MFQIPFGSSHSPSQNQTESFNDLSPQIIAVESVLKKTSLNPLEQKAFQVLVPEMNLIHEILIPLVEKMSQIDDTNLDSNLFVKEFNFFIYAKEEHLNAEKTAILSAIKADSVGAKVFFYALDYKKDILSLNPQDRIRGYTAILLQEGSCFKSSSKILNTIFNKLKKEPLLNADLQNFCLNLLSTDSFKNIDFVKFFVENYIDLKTISDDSAYLMFKSFVKQGNLEAIIYLLDQGLNLNAKDLIGNTLLHCAAAYGKNNVEDILDLLLFRGLSIDLLGAGNMTPLILAVYFCQYQLIQYLINHGANTQLTDDKNRKAIDYALEMNYNGPELNLLRNE